jgi:hypothetical protein
MYKPKAAGEFTAAAAEAPALARTFSSQLPLTRHRQFSHFENEWKALIVKVRLDSEASVSRIYARRRTPGGASTMTVRTLVGMTLVCEAALERNR